MKKLILLFILIPCLLEAQFYSQSEKAPVSSVVHLASVTIPISILTNYLRADGSSVSRTTYNKLFTSLTKTLNVRSIINENATDISIKCSSGSLHCPTEIITLNCVPIEFTASSLPSGLDQNNEYFIGNEYLAVGAYYAYLYTSAANCLADTRMPWTGGTTTITTALYFPYGKPSNTTNFYLPNLSSIALYGTLPFTYWIKFK
jgi:hypothetical protein